MAPAVRGGTRRQHACVGRTETGGTRTSANVYLSAMAVSDSLLLVASSLVNYLPDVWDIDLPSTNIWTCRTTAPALATLYNGSIWILAAFTVERYVAVRFPFLKRRVYTPRNAGRALPERVGRDVVPSRLARVWSDDRPLDTVSCSKTARVRPERWG